jgi:RNA polymerase sigma factor (sigma-70 family)
LAIESSTLLQQVTTLFRVGTLTGLSDGLLLDRFRLGPAEESEAAFAALVDRHAPLVMQVCRRILGDRHDAEDAAQATFLVLARRAREIRRGDSVASWLYGTAARVAGRARRDAARRRARERRGAEAAMTIHRIEPDQRGGTDAWPELYEELSRLPDRFRLPVLLCHLEGLSYEQAAQRLGCPVRTVQSRLSRAREKLRARLIRRGVGPDSAALSLASALRPDASWTATALPEAWKHATVTAAVRYAAGETATALVSDAVAALIEGDARIMILHRCLKWAAALVGIGVAAGGAAMATHGLARPGPTGPDRDAVALAEDKEYRASFQGDATVEVVGISTVPTGPGTWWKPDGTPLAEAPADRIESRFGPEKREVARVILVRSNGVKRDDMFRWHPTHTDSYWGGRPTKDGKPAPELDYYEATFDRDRAECGVQVRVAAGPWTTEARNDGGGGVGMFVNGHKFSFGKARPYQSRGRDMTVFAVAHNFMGRDRRLVAIDRDGKTYVGQPSAGSDGDPRWVLDIIDAEFSLPPEQIKEFHVQFRPYEEKEIPGVALHPKTGGAAASPPNAEAPKSEARPASPLASALSAPDADTDGDGLTDYQEIHKYRTDPAKLSTAGDGVSDGDWQRRREFTYSIRSVVKVMPPVDPSCMNDDYQDARVLGKGANFVELEVIHYPLNTNARAIRSDPDWRHHAASMAEYLHPGITTNWDDAMRRELVGELKAGGIDPDRLDDRELADRASNWLLNHSRYLDNTFCTHYMDYPGGRAAIYPGLEDRFEHAKGDRGWSVQEQLEHELFGRSMFAHRTRGSCTSTAVYLTTGLRAVGIPTRMVLGIPMVDGNDPAQLAMVRDGIHHHPVRRELTQGLSGTQGYANHTFNEVFVGGRWVRLNYGKLGQNSLDATVMGMLTHVLTFKDLSEVPLAATWGKRYALGERDAVFRYGNPYRCGSVSDHFGRFARVDNPEVKEHRTITISRAYWADSKEACEEIKSTARHWRGPGSGQLFIHGEEWIEGEPWQQYKVFMQAAGKEWLLRADGRPDIHARITTSSVVGRDLHELELLIEPDEYARMEPGVEYTLVPRNEVPGYQWKTKGRVTVAKERRAGS